MTETSMLIETIAAPVRQQVVEMVRAAIASGRFVPGQRLVEKDLCQLMGVSRPSVREALRQLESEGLIKNLPNRGPVVSTLSLEEARDIYQVRAALEALATKLFVAVADDKLVFELEAAMVELEHAYESSDIDKVLLEKQKFYDIILKGSRNKFIPPVLQTINARITLLRRVSLSSPHRIPESVREIRTIVEAVKRRDGAAAYEASMYHIEKAAEIAIESLRG